MSICSPRRVRSLHGAHSALRSRPPGWGSGSRPQNQVRVLVDRRCSAGGHRLSIRGWQSVSPAHVVRACAGRVMRPSNGSMRTHPDGKCRQGCATEIRVAPVNELSLRRQDVAWRLIAMKRTRQQGLISPPSPLSEVAQRQSARLLTGSSQVRSLPSERGPPTGLSTSRGWTVRPEGSSFFPCHRQGVPCSSSSHMPSRSSSAASA